MIAVPDENLAGAVLLLEMALEAEGGVALGEQALVHRAVRRMAAEAAFADRFVFENERPALGGVTLETGSVLAQQHRAAALHALGAIRPATLYGVAFMRIVAI